MLIFLLLLFPMFDAHAIEFTWLDPANTQVIVLRDAMADIALRVAAIDRAEVSVDSITYAQGVDSDIGMPLLQAFRRAAARGLQGRYLTGGLAAITNDPGNHFEMMLADSSLKSPAQVVVFGALRSFLTRYDFYDMPHEKILILDRGTPNETIFIGGRNNFKNTRSDLDLAFVLRRVDPTKPWIGDQLHEVFENTWDPAMRTFKPTKPVRRNPKLLPAADRNSVVPLVKPESQVQFKELNALLALPVASRSAISPYEDRPQRMRVVSNDLLGRILTGIYPTFKSRERHVQDDIIKAASPVIATAKKIYVCLMSVYLPEQLKAALKTALQNGAEVEFYTNSAETHAAQMPGGVAYFGGLKDLLELMSVKGGRLNVYVLSDELLKKHGGLYDIVNYTHRKVIIADGKVWSGSGNFNEGSRTRNSEVVIEGDDPSFIARLVSIIESDKKVFNQLSCEQALTQYRGFGILRRGLNRLLMPLY